MVLMWKSLNPNGSEMKLQLLFWSNIKFIGTTNCKIKNQILFLEELKDLEEN